MQTPFKVLQSVIGLLTRSPLRRAELEARVLADQPRPEIAQQMRLDATVIAAFEFFAWDVRPRLHDGDWIQSAAVAWDPDGALPRHSVPVVWRLAGYQFGVAAVNLLKNAVSRSRLSQEGIDAYLEPDVTLPVELKRWVASLRLPLPRTPNAYKRFEMLNELSNSLAVEVLVHRGSTRRLSWRIPGESPPVTDDRALVLTRAYLHDVE